MSENQTETRYIIVVSWNGEVRPMRASGSPERWDGSEFAHIPGGLTIPAAADHINARLHTRGLLPVSEVDVVSQVPARVWSGAHADSAPRWYPAG